MVSAISSNPQYACLRIIEYGRGKIPPMDPKLVMEKEPSFIHRGQLPFSRLVGQFSDQLRYTEDRQAIGIPYDGTTSPSGASTAMRYDNGCGQSSGYFSIDL